MKYTISLLLIFGFTRCKGQVRAYKEYSVCNAWEVHKGKKNHGQKYCVGSIMIQEYKNGIKDTVSWFIGGKIFIEDDYEKYEKLSERGKYIVDSLQEDGITRLHQNYLIYEPRFMKYGKKTEQLWSIEGNDIIIYEYLFCRSKNENGAKLLKMFNVKQ